MNPSKILRKAKALIDTPEKWCQEAYAISKNGYEVAPLDSNACKFCSMGAIHRINESGEAEDSAFRYVRIAMGSDIDAFNDTHTHAEVMDKWDEAIALAEADEKEGV